tara:strand:- start:500 stop:697 length:198 start_codon:yes stop_codon:yes gene_type:complete
MILSNCCGAPFYEPGWPDITICTYCKEHADGIDDEDEDKKEKELIRKQLEADIDAYIESRVKPWK